MIKKPEALIRREARAEEIGLRREKEVIPLKEGNNKGNMIKSHAGEECGQRGGSFVITLHHSLFIRIQADSPGRAIHGLYEIADVHDKKTRSYNMSRIRSRGIINSKWIIDKN